MKLTPEGVAYRRWIAAVRIAIKARADMDVAISDWGEAHADSEIARREYRELRENKK